MSEKTEIKTDNTRIKVTCSVERVRFYKNGWGIIIVSIDRIKEGTLQGADQFGEVVMKGVMPEPKVGNVYDVIADYIEDPKWGGQYNIHSIWSAVVFSENDKIGQKKFLLSIFTSGQVDAMYKTLKDPFDVLKRNDAAELVQVKGCGMKSAIRWIEKFNSMYHLGKIYTELENYSLTNNMVKRLMDQYKSPDIVIEKVKTNPYLLCMEVDGIGWKTADAIAQAGGITEYDPKRISAYMYQYLLTKGEEGASWITPDELLGAVLDELGDDTPDANISQAIQDMSDKLWWNDEKTSIGLKRYYNIEEKIAKELIRLRDAENDFNYSGWEDVVRHLEHRQGWQYSSEQLDGIKTALENNVVVIEGLAGTGKSTLVSALIEILRSYTYAQCALSGRASSRMSEITGEEGYTIHRLLGAKGLAKFEFNEENPLPYDIIIVDEISMIEARLFYYLLRAVQTGAKLVCLGDCGQLECIGSGNIAYDMIHSPEIATVSLTKIHRQAAASAIITESIKVRKGEQIIEKDWAGSEVRGQLQDLEVNCYSDKSNTYYKIMSAFAKYMKTPEFDVMECQVIVPMKNSGASCTYELNNAIQELYNPFGKNKSEVTLYNGAGKPYVLRTGDKVINTVNTYKIEPAIFNGNLGKIVEFTKDDFGEEVMIVDFIGIGRVTIPEEFWKNIELGYAITVHKFQGSQANNVIFGVDYTAFALLSRELLYTGMTRAKKECLLIAQNSALRYATVNQAISKKQTHLQQCLYDIAHPKLIF